MATNESETKTQRKTPADAAKASAARRAAQEPPAAQRGVARAPAQLAPAPVTEATEELQGHEWLVSELRITLEDGKADVAAVRRRLQVTYVLVVLFSIGLFATGLALVAFPALGFYRGEVDELTFGALGAAGAVLLGLLLYFRPLDRLQALVADSTYVALVKDSFQYQVALRLLSLDTDDPASVERTATYVGEAAQASMDLVYTQMQARRAAGFSPSS